MTYANKNDNKVLGCRYIELEKFVDLIIFDYLCQ